MERDKTAKQKNRQTTIRMYGKVKPQTMNIKRRTESLQFNTIDSYLRREGDIASKT